MIGKTQINNEMDLDYIIAIHAMNGNLIHRKKCVTTLSAKSISTRKKNCNITIRNNSKNPVRFALEKIRMDAIVAIAKDRAALRETDP